MNSAIAHHFVTLGERQMLTIDMLHDNTLTFMDALGIGIAGMLALPGDADWSLEGLAAMLAGASGCSIRRSELRFPLLTGLAGARCPVKFAASRWNPRFARARSLATTAGFSLMELPGDPGQWSGFLTSDHDP